MLPIHRHRTTSPHHLSICSEMARLAQFLLSLLSIFTSSSLARTERTGHNPNLPFLSQPEQVHLSLGDLPNQMTVTWATPIAREYSFLHIRIVIDSVMSEGFSRLASPGGLWQGGPTAELSTIITARLQPVMDICGHNSLYSHRYAFKSGLQQYLL